MPDLTALFSQIQSLMKPHDGPVNWDVAIDMARKRRGPEPGPVADREAEGRGRRRRTARRPLARLGHRVPLRRAPRPPPGGAPSGSSAPPTSGRCSSSPSPRRRGRSATRCPRRPGRWPGRCSACSARPPARWSPARSAPRSARWPARCSPPPTSACRSAEPGKAALVPTNVTAFADGLDVSNDDVLLYLALREAAHQRLFAHVPWLREHLIGSVADYASGIEINTGAQIEEQLRGIDPTTRGRCRRPSRAGCSTSSSPPPSRRRSRGSRSPSRWSRAGSTRSSARPPPSGCRPRPSSRRPYAAAGPPAVRPSRPSPSLVGLELRPRRLRDASTLWGSLRTRQGTEARDGVWMHPDLLPDRRRPRRPAGLPRGRRRARRAERGGLRRRARRPARRHGSTPPTRLPRRGRPDGQTTAQDEAPGDVDTLHREALAELATWSPPAGRARPSPARPLRRPPARPRRRHGALLLPRPPDRRRAGAVGRRRRGAAQPAPQGRTWFHFGGHCEPGDGSLAGDGAARGDRGVRHRRSGPRAASPCTSTSTPSASATRAATSSTSTSASSRSRRPAPSPRSARSRTDVRWWPLDALPEPQDEMHELIAAARAAAGRLSPRRRRRRRRPAAGRAGRRPTSPTGSPWPARRAG